MDSLYSNEYAIFARSLLGLPAAAGGNIYYVNAANGAAGNDGRTPATAVSTLEAAEALCTANQNDIVAIIGDSSGLNLDDTLVWDKNYTHLVGVCAPTHIAQRARIFMNASGTDPDSTPLLQITATGCMFKNFYIFHGINDADALVNVEVTGGRCYFENVHFAGIGHATQGDQAGARSLKLTGAEECTFVDCTIGVDTIARSTTNAELELASSTRRCIFRNCLFLSYADNAGHAFVAADAASSAVDRFVLFDNCQFINAIRSAATQMNEVVVAHASLSGMILINNCQVIGADDWDDADTGRVYVSFSGNSTNATLDGLYRATDES